MPHYIRHTHILGGWVISEVLQYLTIHHKLSCPNIMIREIFNLLKVCGYPFVEFYQMCTSQAATSTLGRQSGAKPRIQEVWLYSGSTTHVPNYTIKQWIWMNYAVLKHKLHFCFKFACLNYWMEDLLLCSAKEYTCNVMAINFILMKTIYDRPG